MYYVSCAVCGRYEHVFMREGCDQCSHGPTAAQMEEARERHRVALEAFEAERQRLNGEVAHGENV